MARRSVLIVTNLYPSAERPDFAPFNRQQFAALADKWWDPDGPFRPLHRLGPTRMGFVTVVDVDLSRDFRHATIHISILAEHEGEERRILQALKSAKGFVQKTIAGRLRTRTTPLIEFEQSKGPRKSIQINNLLDELRLEREAREKAAQAEGLQAEASEDE